MPRLMLSDEWWSKLRVIMNEHRIYDKPELRKTIEGILYRLRTGCPWRDLPCFFGLWNSIYQQFNRWSYYPRKSNSTIGNKDIDWDLYQYRHLIENVFARLKHFRAIATRYDKLKRNYKSMLALACGYLWLPL